MENYFLLRSNKKSGPFSLQQLLSLGFKPYDLVWIEGKSAAWRYPSEVNELKDHASAVEEQPFDRFFKKETDKKEIPTKNETNVIPKTTLSTKVFVSMPNTPSKPIQPVSRELSFKTEAEPEMNATVVASRREPDPELKTKHYQSLDEIKEQYIETYLKRKKNAGKIKNLNILTRIGVGVLSVLILGTLAYTAFTSSDDGANNNTQRKNVTVITPQPLRPETLPSENSSSLKTETIQQDNKILSGINKIETHSSKTEQHNLPTNNKGIKKEVSTVTENNYAGVAINEGDKRNSTVRSESIPKAEKPENLSKMVSVKANDYKRRAFGGIQNLELTVSNNSHFMLDKVIVVLEYLKPSEQVLKAEQIHFNSVAPNGTMTIKIPDNPRGIKIACSVYSVESAAYEKSMAGL